MVAELRQAFRDEGFAHPVVRVRERAFHLQLRTRDNAGAIGEDRLAVQHELGECARSAGEHGLDVWGGDGDCLIV